MKKRKNWIKITAIVISSLVLIYLAGRYGLTLYSNYGDKLEPYTINNENSEKQILIAAQKTAFKNDVMDEIISKYKNENVYISVIDVRQLPDVSIDQWDKIIIFSAIKMYKFHPGIETFLKGIQAKNKIFMYNTSTSTIMDYDGVDSITSPSINQQNVASKIIIAIDSALF